jgi:F-box/leucine-rich repeat protein 2/20
MCTMNHALALFQCSSLFILSCSRVANDRGIVALAEGCAMLTTLTLQGCPAITDVGMQAIGVRCARLTEVVLEGATNGSAPMISACRVTDDGIIALATGCPHLRSLVIDSVAPITDASFEAIGAHCRKLVAISINAVGVDRLLEQHPQHPAAAAAADAKIIGVTSNGVAALANGCSVLRFVSLCGWTQVTCAGLKELGRCCPLLVCARFGSTGVANAGVIALARGCPQLKLANFSGTDITDVAVAELVSQCHRLEFIRLVACNRLTDASVDSIVAVDRDVSRVMKAELTHSQGISPEAAARLQDYVEKAAVFADIFSDMGVG